MEDDKYSLGLRVIHWLMAVFIIGMLCSGLYMKSLPLSNEIKFNIYAIHKACGITILGLIIVRIFFRVFTYVPPLPANFSRFVINASKIVHFGLYSLMVLMPLSGYVMSSASGKKIKYFFHIPLLINQNKDLANTANQLHSMLACFMVLFIILHILGALKHTFIDKQNIFKRYMLSSLWKKGTDFLGSEFAIMGGAMSWVSERNLVSAISNAGSFGVIACGAMFPDLLKKEIIETQKLTNKSFGVNLITMHPKLSELIDVCIETKVSHIVLAGGLPTKPNIEKIKSAGIKVMCFAPALSLAKRLVKMGVDALIIEGMEAGGHIGPVSTSVLAQEILPHFKNEQIPVFVAGGIGRGEMIVNYLEMGASGCQIGTLFVCTNESIAHKNFKKVFIKSAARNAIPSVQISADFPVIPVRAIANKASDDFMKHQKKVIDEYQKGQISKEDGQLEIEKFWAGALRRAVIDGDVETGSLMAGQSVGMVDREKPVKEVIDILIQQANNYIEM